MTFFNGIKTYQALKDAYRKLARKLHPDIKGGNPDQFIKMKEEYDRLFKKLKNVDTEKESKNHNTAGFDFKKIIEDLIFMENADIEIIGSWIWVWGIKWEDVEKREKLKSLGFQWSKGRKAWGLGERPNFWKKGLTNDQMRVQFGSEKIESKKVVKPLLN